MLTVPVAEAEVGRLDVQLEGAVVVAEVAEPLPHVEGVALPAEVELVRLQVVDLESIL
jgi:hypothetical protein